MTVQQKKQDSRALIEDMHSVIEIPRYRTAQRLAPSEGLDGSEDAVAGGIDIYLVFIPTHGG